MSRPPLNGTRTHPLSTHSLAILRALCAGPMLAHTVNPGVINRLEREELAAVITYQGKRYLQVTEHGRARAART